MTFDGRTGLSLIWNDLGLVEKVSLNGEDLVNYSYLADGTKVSALDGDGDGLLYLGSLIYRKTGSNISLESAGFAGGRFVARETLPGVSSMVPMFHVTDHLGSVRAVVDGVSGEVVETNDYYPFGSRWNTTASLTDQSNRFRYNSKEEQSSLYPASVRNAVSYIDYGARQYDPVVGRWFAQDPLSEKYYSISPYTFCANNPVRFVDPDGEAIGTLSGAILGAIFGGVNAYIKGENVKKGIVSGSISGAITGAAVDLAVASGGTLGIVFGASVIGGAVGGVTGDVIGAAVVNENITISDVIEAGYNGAVAGAVSGTISVGSHAISTTAKGTIKGLFGGVDDVKSSLPSASDEIVSEISQKVAQSEQQAMKNVDRSQLYFEIFTEAVYFISNQTNEK